MNDSRDTQCTACGQFGYWLTNREDDLPAGHESDLALCGGDGVTTLQDRPYCDACLAPVACVICGQPGGLGHEIRRAEDGISYPGVAERDMYVGGTCRLTEDTGAA